MELLKENKNFNKSDLLYLFIFKDNEINSINKNYF